MYAIRSYYDIAEFVGIGQAALYPERHLELLALGNRRHADLARRGLDVLFLHRLDHIGA